MSIDWQNLLVLAVVATAAAYLVRQAIRFFRRSFAGGGSCGGCGSCAKGSSTLEGKPLVTLELMAKRPGSRQ